MDVLFFFQAEDGRRDLVRSRGLGDVYKRQEQQRLHEQARHHEQDERVGAKHHERPQERLSAPRIKQPEAHRQRDRRQAAREQHVGTGPEALVCLLYTSPSPRDRTRYRMPSSA